MLQLCFQSAVAVSSGERQIKLCWIVADVSVIKYFIELQLCIINYVIMSSSLFKRYSFRPTSIRLFSDMNLSIN